MTEHSTSAGALPISDLVGDPVVRIDAGASLYEVADALAAAGVSALVVGEGDHPTGIVTERDLAGALADRRDPAEARAGDIAHTTLVWCDQEATVAEVAGEMMSRYVRHVLVEEGGCLVGIVSARDLLGIYASGDVEATAG
ncbi:MAG TPA: CBS domain-containing protein [Acidimicrobiales bacterium]|nr:CBS domain-containing protein [Acidimicrobiales bacterium]